VGGEFYVIPASCQSKVNFLTNIKRLGAFCNRDSSNGESSSGH